MDLAALAIVAGLAALVGAYVYAVVDKWRREERAGRRHRFIHLVEPFTDVTRQKED